MAGKKKKKKKKGQKSMSSIYNYKKRK